MIKSKATRVLNQLAKIDKSSLGRKVVARLLGITVDAVDSRFKRRGLSSRKKGDIVKVAREFKPMIDGWCRPDKAARKTRIPETVLRGWARNQNLRAKIGVKNAGGHLYYSPAWIRKAAKKVKKARGWKNLLRRKEVANMLGISVVSLGSFKLFPVQFTGERSRCYYTRTRVVQIKRRIERTGGWENLISTREATDILGLSRHKMAKTKLARIQFGGKRSKCYFRKDQVLRLKNRCNEANLLYSTRDIAGLLELEDDQVLKIVSPTTHHPVSGEPKYDQGVLDQHQCHFLSASIAFHEILKYCEDHICRNPPLKKKVKQLVYEKVIPWAGKDGNVVYLSGSSEEKIKAIYRNYRFLEERDNTLLTITQAASQLPISERQLRHLVDYYGKPEQLCLSKTPSTTINSGGGIRFQIPYVIYINGYQLYFLVASIVRCLDGRIRSLQQDLAVKGKQLSDVPWRARLVDYDNCLPPA